MSISSNPKTALLTSFQGTRAKRLSDPDSLFEWIISFTSLVVGSLGLLCAAVALWWPINYPLTVWEVIAGISSSAVVALVAGMITIFISWETSLHFGRISTTEIAGHLQDSLASTLSSASDFLTTARGILGQGELESHSLVMIAMPSELLLETDPVGNEVAQLIRKRFETDSPTVLALTTHNLPKGFIWEQLAYSAKDETEFRQRFTSRSSFVITVPSISDALIVRLEPIQGAGFSVKASAFAFPVSTSADKDYAGIRSEVDRGFGRMVLERFCALIQEPTSSYAHSVLTASDVLSGQFIGLSVTRSIITSQLIQSAATAQRLEGASGFWVDIMNPADPKHGIQFYYSSNCFCPPLHSGKNHSGSVIADALRDNRISVTGLSVWEVGCGPGYVTLQLADKVGENGVVFATDIDANASDIAKKNIDDIGRASKVTFINGDCSQFKLKANKDDSSGVTLVAPDASEHRIDMIFIELPLLPYRGTRDLSPVELGYFESVPDDYQNMLPPTIIALLSSVVCLKGKGLTVVLPIAGSSTDVSKVVDEVRQIIGGTCLISTLDDNQNGFISVLLVEIK